ncbi:MAG TPA: peptidylprolyl isomerase [Xanthobacteraceae bacterium]|nr:peptidylprolyl isomerase [Xanthobacteraceae bacterium]
MTVSVNGVAVRVEEAATPELAAIRELLRQRAVACGLLEAAATDAEAVDVAIEALLAREVTTPEPTEAECRRYYDQHRPEFTSGDLVLARHILFQVTSRVNVPQIRARAEQTLNTLLREPERFAALARELSNCPSGRQGGNLGQIGRGETVPEFEAVLFRLGPTGLMRELVKTRYGFHIVAVDQRIPGRTLPFEVAQEAIAARLRARVEEKALRQYVSLLAGQARIEGVALESAATPLVQ